MPSASSKSKSAALGKRDRRKLRRLEQQLAKARAEETRRADRLEQAVKAGGARRIERRTKKFDRAHERGERLAAGIAGLLAGSDAPPESSPPTPKAPKPAKPAKAAPAPKPAKTSKSAEAPKPAKAATPAKTASPTAGAILAYCLRDRERVTMQDPRPVTMRNGQPALAGTCPKCGGGLVRAVARDAG